MIKNFLKHDKKASLGLTKLIMIIVALIGFGLIIASIISTNNAINSLEEETLCHSMLIVQDFTNTKTTLFNPKVKNSCQTMHREISKNVHSPQQVFSEIANYIAQTSWVIGHGNYPDLWGDYDFFRNSECGIVYEIQIPELDMSKESQVQLNYLSLKLFLDSMIYKNIDDVPYTYTDYVMNHPDTKADFSVLIAPFYLQQKKELVEAEVNILQEKKVLTNQYYAITVASIDGSSKLSNMLEWAAFGLIGKIIVDDLRSDATIIWFSTLEEALSSGCVYLNEQDFL